MWWCYGRFGVGVRGAVVEDDGEPGTGRRRVLRPGGPVVAAGVGLRAGRGGGGLLAVFAGGVVGRAVGSPWCASAAGGEEFVVGGGGGQGAGVRGQDGPDPYRLGGRRTATVGAFTVAVVAVRDRASASAVVLSVPGRQAFWKAVSRFSGTAC
ncbi:hypothetical protein AMK13_38470 [Streptomyces sp. CB02056]|nr:hypothetical protein AMK13_38470 [Streptomyces sp. CB02056]